MFNGRRAFITVVVAVGALILSGPLLIRSLSVDQRAFFFRLQMILFIEGSIFIGSWYAWITFHKILYKLSRRSRSGLVVCCTWFTKVVLFIVLLLAQMSFVVQYLIHGEEPPVLSFACFVCLGILVQFVICHFCLHRAYMVVQWASRKYFTGRRAPYNELVVWINFISALVISTTLSVCGLYGASKAPTVRTVEVPIKNLAISMDRLSLVVVSDIHLGPTVGHAKLQRVVRMVNELEPDIIALIGDLTDGSVEKSREAAVVLKTLKARTGKFFVSGNHEYYTGDVMNWFKHMEEELGFVVLHNSHVNISDNSGGNICLAGCDDIAGNLMLHPDHGMDLDKAVGSCDPNRPIILLAHQPRAAKLALDSSYNIQLVLSGHTHGGQMFPMVIIAYFVNPFFAGLYHYGQGYVYVTQGAVYWGIPMRMFSESEISRVFLRSV